MAKASAEADNRVQPHGHRYPPSGGNDVQAENKGNGEHANNGLDLQDLLAAR